MEPRSDGLRPIPRWYGRCLSFGVEIESINVSGSYSFQLPVALCGFTLRLERDEG